MKDKVTTWSAALAALACAASVQAHHSASMIDVSKSHWVKGTVVLYAPVSPHARIELEETKDGEVQRWTIEGPFPGRLNRILSLNGLSGDAEFLRPGDVVEVCGFFPKRSTGTSPNDDGAPRRFVHGQVLVMPDGRLQSWGPYGKIDNCVRSGDRPERWLDFLNADPLAREFWCIHLPRIEGVASTAPQGFVDEINRRLTPPCSQ